MKTDKKIGLVLCGIFLGIRAIYVTEKLERERKEAEEIRKQNLIDQGRQCLHDNFYYEEPSNCTEVVKGS